MPTIEAEIVVDAPIETVFEYVAAPENHAEMNPNVVDVTDVEPLPNGGHEADFGFRMLGRTLHGHVRDVEFDVPRLRVFDVDGDVAARTTYELATVAGGTRVRFTNEIEPPGAGLVGRLAGSLLGRYMQRNAESTLRNAKRILEAAAVEGRPAPTGSGASAR